MRDGIRIFLVTALLLSFAVITGAQNKPLRFAVASVKPNRSGGPPRRIGTEGNRFLAETAPLMLLIQLAYHSPAGTLLRQHVIGVPSWLESDRFDIEAKVEGDKR